VTLKQERILINSIVKNKISNQRGYVLKTKELEDLILFNDINMHIDLYYTQSIGSFFEAIFRVANINYPYNIPYNILHLSVGALLKKDLFSAREKMKEIVLPKFIVWINNILALPDNSTCLYREACFRASFKDNLLEISETTR